MKTAKEVFMYCLAAVIVIGIFILVGLLIFQEMPTSNKELLILVIGNLMAAFISVISYFFGSSKGSADKTEILKNGTT